MGVTIIHSLVITFILAAPMEFEGQYTQLHRRDFPLTAR